MVVTARDSFAAEQGLDSVATEDMPLDAFGEMPSGDDDAALSDGEIDDEAATESDDAPIDPLALLDATQRAEVETLIRQQLEAKFDTDKRNLQRLKDREVADARKETARFQAREAAYQHFMNDLVNRVQQGEMPDMRDIKAFRADMLEAERTAETQQAESEQSFTQWFQTSTQRMLEHMESKSKGPAGNVLFDYKTDSDVVTATRKLVAAQRRFHQTGTQADHEANTRAFEEHRTLLDSKREQALVAPLPKSTPKKPLTRAQQLERQQKRGVQNTAGSGVGGGGGTFNADEVVANAWKLYPTDDAARAKYVTDAQAAARPR